MRLYRGVIEGRVDRETKNGKEEREREERTVGREEQRQGKGREREEVEESEGERESGYCYWLKAEASSATECLPSIYSTCLL